MPLFQHNLDKLVSEKHHSGFAPQFDQFFAGQMLLANQTYSHSTE